MDYSKVFEDIDVYGEHQKKLINVALDIIDLCKKENLTYEEVVQILQMSETLLKKMAVLKD